MVHETLVVDVEAVKPTTAELALEVGIVSFSPSIYSFFALIPTNETYAKT